MNTTLPIACTLTTDELAERREELLPGLLEQAEKIDDLPDGLRLHFASRSGLLEQLARIIEQERMCCRFLRFQVSAEPDEGSIILEVTGPEGTREILRSL